MGLRAHYKPIGIATASTLTTFLNYYFQLGFEWYQLGLVCALLSFVICYPKKTACGIRDFFTIALPTALAKIWDTASHLNKLLTAVSWSLVFPTMMFHMFAVAGILLGGSYNNPNKPPLYPWYVTFPVVAFVVGYIFVLLYELALDEKDNHKSLTRLEFFRTHDNWRHLWVIALCIPGLGHMLATLVMIPWLCIGVGMVLIFGWEAFKAIFSTLFVAWNSREGLVCLSDGFISAALTKLYIVKDLDGLGWSVLGASFVIGYFVGFAHYNLIKPLTILFEPYRIKSGLQTF